MNKEKIDGSVELNFFADVFAWFPDGRIQKVSPGDGIYYQSCVHPEGTGVVFFGNSYGAPRVWKADLKTFEVIPLTPSVTGARHPVFSWDGKSIVFSSDRVDSQMTEQVEDMKPNGLPPDNLKLNLFIMDSDGGNIRQVTTGPYQDQRPCFSPDGSHIVFVSNRLGPFHRLCTVLADGSMGTRQLQKDGWGYRPWYSADGKSIFFFTDIDGRSQICTIPAKGGDVVPLANDDGGPSRGPFADPDGKHLWMHSFRGGKWGIWKLPLDGSPPHALPIPGIDQPTHPSRAKNGIITFDVIRSLDFDPAIPVKFGKVLQSQ